MLHQRLALHARRQPKYPALLWPGGRLDYGDLPSVIDEQVERLRGSGCRVVGCMLDNGPAWALLDLAALTLGICMVPLPPFFSPAQLAHLVERSGLQAILTDDPKGLRQRLAGRIGRREDRWRIAGSSVVMLDVVPAGGDGIVPPGVHKVTFTSGTTGEPKGVMLSWSAMRKVVTSLVEVAAFTAADRHLTLMPLSVLLENIAGLYAPLWAGAQVSLPPLAAVGLQGSSGLDAETMNEALWAGSASTAIFTPQTLQGLVEVLERRLAKRPGLRFAAVGGAPVAERLLARAAAVGLPVYEGYGLSEQASVVTLNAPGRNRRGSVGRPLPHVRLRVAADGEVVLQERLFEGYLGEPAALPAHWHSGDVGELDAYGYLHLHGRRRNVFITAFGRNVAPEWVERELALEPAIAQAAVFGEARPFNVALLVPAAGASAADLGVALARANALLPDYAQVNRWLRAEAPFTAANGLMTGTGRIRREALLERYGAQLESLYCEVNI